MGVLGTVESELEGQRGKEWETGKVADPREGDFPGKAVVKKERYLTPLLFFFFQYILLIMLLQLSQFSPFPPNPVPPIPSHNPTPT